MSCNFRLRTGRLLTGWVTNLVTTGRLDVELCQQLTQISNLRLLKRGRAIRKPCKFILRYGNQLLRQLHDRLCCVGQVMKLFILKGFKRRVREWANIKQEPKSDLFALSCLLVSIQLPRPFFYTFEDIRTDICLGSRSTRQCNSLLLDCRARTTASGRVDRRSPC